MVQRVFHNVRLVVQMTIYYATMGEILATALFAVMAVLIAFTVLDDFLHFCRKRVKIDKRVYKQRKK